MNDSVARPVNYDKQEMNGKRTTLQAKPRFSHFMVHKTAENNRWGGGSASVPERRFIVFTVRIQRHI